VSTLATAAQPTVPVSEEPLAVGPLGRLGGWTTEHVRAVSVAWLLVAVVLAAFAPKVETVLSGAGWQANGSESVQARALIQRNFGGLSRSALMVVVHSTRATTAAPAFRQTVTRVERILRANPHVSHVQAPARHRGRPGQSDADGRRRGQAEVEAARGR
jgi:RND superfamily putative drug exporter